MKALALVLWLILWPFSRVLATWWDARAGYRYSISTMTLAGLVDVAIWFCGAVFIVVKL